MTIPFDRVIWNAQQCADYLGQSRQEFLRLTRHKQGFPSELVNRPRHWQALAVTEWALAGVFPLPSSPKFTHEPA
jgi:uncharacterized membrane protein YjdF